MQRDCIIGQFSTNGEFLLSSYELGGGAAQITSSDPVNDNKEHVVKLIRKGRDGKMVLDGKQPIEGTSSGILAMLNVEGHIYLGQAGSFFSSFDLFKKEKYAWD